MDRPNLSYSEDAINAINNYPWPGNVREMINKVKRAIIMANSKRVTAEDLELDGGQQGQDQQLNLRKVRENAEIGEKREKAEKGKKAQKHSFTLTTTN